MHTYDNKVRRNHISVSIAYLRTLRSISIRNISAELPSTRTYTKSAHNFNFARKDNAFQPQKPRAWKIIAHPFHPFHRPSLRREWFLRRTGLLCRLQGRWIIIYIKYDFMAASRPIRLVKRCHVTSYKGRASDFIIE